MAGDVVDVATCSIPMTLTVPTTGVIVSVKGRMLDSDGETVVVPTTGVTSTVDGGTVCVDGITSCRYGVIGSVATPETVAVEGDTKVEDIVLAPVTVVVVGEITDVDSVATPLTVAVLGVTEATDTVEEPVTEVVCTGTVTEDGKIGPTTMGFTIVAMTTDIAIELTNIHSKKIQTTFALQSWLISPLQLLEATLLSGSE